MPLLLVPLLFHFLAYAQDSELATRADSARALKIEGVVGSGYLNEPFVMGSASPRPIFYPFLDLNLNDRVTINSDDGIYVAGWRNAWFELGAHAFYSWGRDGSYYRSEDRAETETVPETVVVGLSLWKQLSLGEVTLSWDHGLSPGQSGRVNLAWAFKPLEQDRWRIEITPEVNWASAEYMNTFFGISPESAAETGLASYRPNAGFESVGTRFSVRYHPRLWHLVAQASVAYFELVDQARRSPLNETTGMKSLFLALGYEFF